MWEYASILEDFRRRIYVEDGVRLVHTSGNSWVGLLGEFHDKSGYVMTLLVIPRGDDVELSIYDIHKRRVFWKMYTMRGLARVTGVSEFIRRARGQ